MLQYGTGVLQLLDIEVIDENQCDISLSPYRPAPTIPPTQNQSNYLAFIPLIAHNHFCSLDSSKGSKYLKYI